MLIQTEAVNAAFNHIYKTIRYLLTFTFWYSGSWEN